MDKPRQGIKRNRNLRRGVYLVFFIVAVTMISIGLSRLEPAAPSVDRGTLWVEQVKRGEMLRQVRGAGRLVAENIWFISAAREGRVERVLLKPGTQVTTDTLLLELSNPELELQAFDALREAELAEADLLAVEVRIRSNILELEAQVASTVAQHEEAKLRLEMNEELAAAGTVAELDLKLSQVKAVELGKLKVIQEKRLAISTELLDAEMGAQRARVQQAKARYELLQKQVHDLKIRPGTEGILEDVPVEVGQWVTPGTTLAKVVDPSRLKAEVRIPETQARDVQLGLRAEIDTRNGVIGGRVERIDPTVREGTVTIDVALEGELPRGARPDLTIDGTIEIERLSDVLYVGRPVFGQEDSTLGLFKLDSEGGGAGRVQVKLGRSSVTTIEVLGGLAEGDQVILSDTSQWDDYDRIRIK